MIFRRHVRVAAIITMFLYASTSKADPWSELLAAFFGFSPVQIEQFVRDAEQRRWQLTPPAAPNRLATLTRRLSGVIGAITQEPRNRPGTASPRSGMAPRQISLSQPQIGSGSGSPRSTDNSPRQSSPLTAFHRGSPRSTESSPRLAAATLGSDVAGVAPPVIAWPIILETLSSLELRRVAQVSSYFRRMINGIFERPIARGEMVRRSPWQHIFHHLGVIGPIPTPNAANLLREANQLLHRLIIQAAPIELGRRTETTDVGQMSRPDPRRLHELLVEARRLGASPNLMRLDPYAMLSDFDVGRRSDSVFLLEAILTARQFLVWPDGPGFLYQDIYELALRGNAEAQSIIVTALQEGRFSQNERSPADRMRELNELALRGWLSAQEAIAEMLDLGCADGAVPANHHQLLDCARLGWTAAQNRVVENWLRQNRNATPQGQTMAFERLLAWGRVGWPKARFYVARALAFGELAQSERSEAERMAELETLAAEGWVQGQELLVLHLSRLSQLQSPSERAEQALNAARLELLYILFFGDSQVSYAYLSQVFEPCLTARCPRGMDTLSALYALAARGWRAAQQLYLEEAWRRFRLEEPSLLLTDRRALEQQRSRLELLRWYFDLVNQLRERD